MTHDHLDEMLSTDISRLQVELRRWRQGQGNKVDSTGTTGAFSQSLVFVIFAWHFFIPQHNTEQGHGASAEWMKHFSISILNARNNLHKIKGVSISREAQLKKRSLYAKKNKSNITYIYFSWEGLFSNPLRTMNSLIDDS